MIHVFEAHDGAGGVARYVDGRRVTSTSEYRTGAILSALAVAGGITVPARRARVTSPGARARRARRKVERQNKRAARRAAR